MCLCVTGQGSGKHRTFCERRLFYVDKLLLCCNARNLQLLCVMNPFFQRFFWRVSESGKMSFGSRFWRLSFSNWEFACVTRTEVGREGEGEEGGDETGISKGAGRQGGRENGKKRAAAECFFSGEELETSSFCVFLACAFMSLIESTRGQRQFRRSILEISQDYPHTFAFVIHPLPLPLSPPKEKPTKNLSSYREGRERERPTQVKMSLGGQI